VSDHLSDEINALRGRLQELESFIMKEVHADLMEVYLYTKELTDNYETYNKYKYAQVLEDVHELVFNIIQGVEGHVNIDRDRGK
jgi:hypothetical protein